MEPIKYRLLLLPADLNDINGRFAPIYKLGEHIYKAFKDMVRDDAIPHHLYLISNEEVKVDDCFLDSYDYRVYQALPSTDLTFINHPTHRNSRIFKLVATTDKSLDILSIPDEFISEYVKERGDFSLITYDLIFKPAVMYTTKIKVTVFKETGKWDHDFEQTLESTKEYVSTQEIQKFIEDLTPSLKTSNYVFYAETALGNDKFSLNYRLVNNVYRPQSIRTIEDFIRFVKYRISEHNATVEEGFEITIDDVLRHLQQHVKK